MHLPQSLTNIVALKKRIERIRLDETVLSGKFCFWAVNQRQLGLKCAAEDCENEPLHIDAHGIAFCISHFEGGLTDVCNQ